jgi:hypothetical protein
MPELTLQHVDQISRDITDQEISFSHLLDDLIDHVCCDVEYEMQNGLTFSEAYQRVKQKMGPRRIKEIQEETLYTIDNKYRNMKKAMKISGVTGTILFGFASMFKIQHFPGSTILMTLGAILLAFVFLPSALGVLWKETHNSRKIFLFISAFLGGMFLILGTLFKINHWPGATIILSLAILFGILFFIPALLANRLNGQKSITKRIIYILGAAGIILYTNGMLFKIQHWPLATLFLVAGMILLCAIAFPLYTWLTWREEEHISAKFIFILIGALVIIVPGTLINLNLQNSYDYGYYSNLQQQQVLYKVKYDNNLLYLNQHHDSSAFTKMDEFHAKTTRILLLIGGIQTKMVAESEGKPGIPALSPSQVINTERGPEIQYELLSQPFLKSPVINFLVAGSTSRLEINAALKEYSASISDTTSGEAVQKYKNLLEPSVFLPGEIQDGSQISLLSGLHSLELMKNNILTVESFMLTSFANN